MKAFVSIYETARNFRGSDVEKTKPRLHHYLGF